MLETYHAASRIVDKFAISMKQRLHHGIVNSEDVACNGLSREEVVTSLKNKVGKENWVEAANLLAMLWHFDCADHFGSDFMTRPDCPENCIIS